MNLPTVTEINIHASYTSPFNTHALALSHTKHTHTSHAHALPHKNTRIHYTHTTRSPSCSHTHDLCALTLTAKSTLSSSSISVIFLSRALLSCEGEKGVCSSFHVRSDTDPRTAHAARSEGPSHTASVTSVEPSTAVTAASHTHRILNEKSPLDAVCWGRRQRSEFLRGKSSETAHNTSMIVTRFKPKEKQYVTPALSCSCKTGLQDRGEKVKGPRCFLDSCGKQTTTLLFNY